MKRIAVWGLLIAVVFAVAAPAWAAEGAAAAVSKPCKMSAAAHDDASSYIVKAGAALGHGASNLALGWTEILIEPVRTTQAKGNVGVGFVRGLGLALKRTVLGAVEVVTFWTPKSRGHYLQFNHDCAICSPKP